MNKTSSHRRKGKVAALSKELRDFVNQQLDDGVTYAVIADALQKRGVSVNAENLSNWKQGGYQDYLQAQDRRERMTLLHDRFLDPAEGDPIQLASGALHGTMIQICELMDKLHATPDETDPKTFVAVANTLSRFSRSMIKISQYRDELQKARAADPMSKEARAKAREEFLDKMDEMFGIRPTERFDRIFGYEHETSDRGSNRDHEPHVTAPSSSNDETNDWATSPVPMLPSSESVNVSATAPTPSVPRESVTDNTTPVAGITSTMPAETSVASPSLSSSGGESRREEANKNDRIEAQPIGTPPTGSLTESEKITQPSSVDPKTAEPVKWVPLDQRPWNWTDIPEFASMPSFPPTDP